MQSFTFQTLEKTDIEQLLEVFNLSFSDYIVPFSLTKAQFESKIKNDRIELQYSAGAFNGHQLVGFILHGFDKIGGKKTLYNAGTGVIPTKRGHGISTALYAFLLPMLYKNRFDKIVLEVISTNVVAQRIYEQMGFKKIRNLHCLKGSIQTSAATSNFELRPLKAYNWQQFQTFWDIVPSWQNAIQALEISKYDLVSYGIYDAETCIGYTVFNSNNQRILQLATEKSHRKRGAALQLLSFLAENYGAELSIMNVDGSSRETIQFLKNVGLEVFITQFEMAFELR